MGALSRPEHPTGKSEAHAVNAILLERQSFGQYRYAGVFGHECNVGFCLRCTTRITFAKAPSGIIPWTGRSADPIPPRQPLGARELGEGEEEQGGQVLVGIPVVGEGL